MGPRGGFREDIFSKKLSTSVKTLLVFAPEKWFKSNSKNAWERQVIERTSRWHSKSG
jgi:hypothetical protein